MKYQKKILTLASGTWKLHLGHLCPEVVSSHMSRTIAAIFTNRPSFSQGSWNESNKIMISFDLGVCYLETTFGPLVPRRRIKPYVQNRSCNFHKQAIIFSRIMRWIQWNYEISKKFLNLESGTRKLHLGHLGHLAPADGSGHMSRTIAAIFTNRPSFSQESWDKSEKVMKSQKMF